MTSDDPLIISTLTSLAQACDFTTWRETCPFNVRLSSVMATPVDFSDVQIELASNWPETVVAWPIYLLLEMCKRFSRKVISTSLWWLFVAIRLVPVRLLWVGQPILDIIVVQKLGLQESNFLNLFLKYYWRPLMSNNMIVSQFQVKVWINGKAIETPADFPLCYPQKRVKYINLLHWMQRNLGVSKLSTI